MASPRAHRPHRRSAVIGVLAILAVAVAGSVSFQAESSSSSFADGFEAGTLEAWKRAEGLVAVRGGAYEGSWSAQAAADAGASFANAVLAPPADAGTARLAFAVHDLTTPATLLKLRTTDGPPITVGLNLRHQIFAYMPSSELVVDETHQVTDGAWHVLEVAFVTGDDARAQISVDGVPVKEFAAPSGSGPVTRLGIGTRRDGRTFDIRFDEVTLTSEGGQDPDPSPDPDPDPSGSVVTAAGDIACDPADLAFNGGLGTNRACRMADTAELLSGADVVMPLGDIQYEDGALELYADSYGPTWGEWLPITRPVVGNHEYEQPDAAAYFSYFGAAAGTPGEGWYSFDSEGWHVVVLNSECRIVGCGPGSAQYEWLQRDLDASDAMCTLAAWHRPRFSSGHHGGDASTAPMWQLLDDEGAELVLSGHDHHYERFAPQDATGSRTAAGMRQFVVGTGGKNANRLEGAPAGNSLVRSDDTIGVLRLTLDDGSYDWRFLPVAGSTFSDAGSASCG